MKNIIKKSLVNINYSLFKSRKSKSIFFHDVHSKNEYVKNGDISTPIEKFAKYVSIIKDNGFSIVDEISNLNNEIEISFDDGYYGIFENIDFFINQNINIKIFISPSLFKDKNYMSSNNIKELSKLKNISFGSHSYSHKRLDGFNEKELEHELIKSKQIIESLANQEVNSFCFPLGFFNDNIIDVALKTGYKNLYSCIPGPYFKLINGSVIRRSIADNVSENYFKNIVYGADYILSKWYQKKHYLK